MMKHTNRQVDVMLGNKLERKYLTEKYDTSVNFQDGNEHSGKPYERNKRLLDHCYEDRRYISEPTEQYVYRLSESSKPANMNVESDFRPVIKFVNERDEFLSDIVNPDVNYLTKEQRYQFKSFDKTTQPIQLVKMEGEYGNRSQARYTDERKSRKESKDNVVVDRVRKLSDSIASALTSLTRRRGSKSFNLEDAYEDTKNDRNGMNKEITYHVGPEGYDPDDKFEFNKHFSEMKLKPSPNIKETSVMLTSSNYNEPSVVETAMRYNSGDVLVIPHAIKSKIDNNILEESVTLKNSQHERTNNANLSNGVLINKSSNYRNEDSESHRNFQSVKAPSGYSSVVVKEPPYRDRASIENLINDCKANDKSRRKLSLPTLKKVRALKNKSFDTLSLTPEIKMKESSNENRYCQRNTIPNAYTSIQEEYVSVGLPNVYSTLRRNEGANNKTLPTCPEKSINARPEIPAWKQTKQVHIENTANNDVYRSLESRDIGNQNINQLAQPKLKDMFLPITRDESKHSEIIRYSLPSNTRQVPGTAPTYDLARHEVAQLQLGNFFACHDDDEEDEDVLLNNTIQDIKPEPISDWSNTFGRRSLRNKLSGYTVSKKYRFR